MFSRIAVFLYLAALWLPLASSASEAANAGSWQGTPDPRSPGGGGPLPDAPDPHVAANSPFARGYGRNSHLRLATRPFSALAVGVTVGAGGLGFEVGTPLATKVNLRGSVSFLNYHPTITEDGIPIDGSIRFRTASMGVEVFPYHNSFHITPGLTFYNGNHAGATTNIPGGSTFTVNDTTYVSSAADPVHGTFDVDLGRKIAPSLTIGFGNMLRRSSHWSIPVDFGVEYIGTPKFTLNLTGSVCTPADGCTPIQSDADTVANLNQEQTTVNSDIAPLRFYPIFKVGLSYRFGRIREISNWR